MPYVTSWERIAKEEGKKEGIELGKQEGIEEGKHEGREEGRLEAKTETAKRMLAEGLDISLIEKVTGLSTEQLIKIKDTTDS